MKQQVLLSESVKEALSHDDVVAFEVDTTNAGSPGDVKFKSYGVPGIPFIVIEGPGVSDPLTNTFPGPAWVVDAIEKARGATKDSGAVLTSG